MSRICPTCGGPMRDVDGIGPRPHVQRDCIKFLAEQVAKLSRDLTRHEGDHRKRLARDSGWFESDFMHDSGQGA